MTRKTPNPLELSWDWRDFGGARMLVTNSDGAQVVLAPSMDDARAIRRRRGSILTRDPATGIVRAILPTDDVARLIAKAPDLNRACLAQAMLIEKAQQIVANYLTLTADANPTAAILLLKDFLDGAAQRTVQTMADAAMVIPTNQLEGTQT